MQGTNGFILCVPMSVYIDGVFVKCYSKILDCNRFLFSILIFTLILKSAGDLEAKKKKKTSEERVFFVCVLSLLSHKTNVLIFAGSRGSLQLLLVCSFTQLPLDGSL